MRQFFRELNYNLSEHLPTVTRWLFYVLIVTFVAQAFIPEWIAANWLAASFPNTIIKMRLWQILTYPFVGFDAWVLFFNLLTLWFFGGALERQWGGGRFVRFLLFVTIATAAVHFALNAALWASSEFSRGSIAPIWGTTAITFAIIMVYAMYYPDNSIYVFAVFPVKARYLVLIMGIIQLLFLGRNVFGLTNLTGLLFGYLFARFPDAFDRLSLPKLSRRRGPQTYNRGRWRDL